MSGINLTMIRCECGHNLGKVAGKFEFRCPKCKRIVKGTVGASEGAGKTTTAWPKNLLTR